MDQLALLIICILNICAVGIVSGATAISGGNGAYPMDGCILTLPENRNFAPDITNAKTFQHFLPIQYKDSSLSFVAVEHGTQIKISCGRGNSLANFEPYYYLVLSCVRGAQFLNEEEDVVLLPEGVECTERRKPTPIVYRNGTCSGKGTNFDVKFVTESPPRTYYTVCVDEETSATMYSKSYIDGESFANGLGESSGNRPDFRGQEFYPFPIKQAYKWEKLYDHLSQLLGSPETVDGYFPTQQHRFSRGHLFPNADGVKKFEKHATFYYINTVPQWQLLNGGNWNIVEQDVRDFAELLKRRFEIVTGASGVTSLKDGNNNDVDVYMARDNFGNLRLPVPRLVWKVIHDPVGDSAVAIVQVNNPWQLQQDLRLDVDLLCTDVCRNLRWLRSSGFRVMRKGYTYCCDVKELQRHISTIPTIKYSKMLGQEYTPSNTDDSDSDDDDYEDDDDEGYESSNSNDDDDDDSNDDSDSDSSESEVTRRGSTNPSEVKSISDLFSSIKLGRPNM